MARGLLVYGKGSSVSSTQTSTRKQTSKEHLGVSLDTSLPIGRLASAPRTRSPAVPCESAKDIGHLLCEPLVPLIPIDVTPNQITLVNHMGNLLLFLMSLAAHSIFNRAEYPQTYTFLMLSCGFTNFTCMLLDCLDGMHARRTGRSSKVRVTTVSHSRISLHSHDC